MYHIVSVFVNLLDTDMVKRFITGVKIADFLNKKNFLFKSLSCVGETSPKVGFLVLGSIRYRLFKT